MQAQQLHLSLLQSVSRVLPEITHLRHLLSVILPRSEETIRALAVQVRSTRIAAVRSNYRQKDLRRLRMQPLIFFVPFSDSKNGREYI